MLSNKTFLDHTYWAKARFLLPGEKEATNVLHKPLYSIYALYRVRFLSKLIVSHGRILYLIVVNLNKLKFERKIWQAFLGEKGADKKHIY